ncbi:DUF5655 domain-containing protein [Fournierella sp.]|uniref:DUF5655 domain-containing protein n=1 Tax=Allofournierella sp. TaxID=1940256 RepID=UPI0025BDFF7F|nr:DUF5655 domain-containing protein [Fournierella sp.]
MTDDELLFFDSMPQMLPIYEAFCQGLADRGLAFTAKVSRTQISLRNRYVFAAASLPWRKVKGWPEEYLLVSLGLSYHKESPRVAVATEPYPNRWTHHILLTTSKEVDAELLDWTEEAYRFALIK